MTDVNAVLGLALAVNEPREEVMVAEIQGILACAVGRRATVTEVDFKQDSSISLAFNRVRKPP
jgi:hypothetical protein